MNSCDTTLLQEGVYTEDKDFSCCLPFGARIYSAEGIIQYDAPSNIPPDGVYTSITIRNGCIVAVGNADISVFNYAPCASATAANIVSSAASGIAIIGGNGISVHGMGTLNNPYIVSLSESPFGETVSTSGAVYIQAANDGIVVQGEGTAADPITIGHKTEQVFDLINGMKFDRYGHLTSYSSTTGHAYISEVLAGDGISVTKDKATQVVTISLQEATNPINATLNFGKYSITFDKYNRIQKITEDETIEGDGIIPNAYVANYTMRSSTFKEMRVLFAKAANVKVEVDLSSTGVNVSTSSDYIIDVALAIDGQSITFGVMNPTRAVYISNAVYSAGVHTFRFTRPSATASDGKQFFIAISAVWLL